MIVIDDWTSILRSLERSDNGTDMVDMITAPGLVDRAGVPWCRAIRERLDGRPVRLWLDCGDSIPRAIEAIRAEAGPVIFRGKETIFDKLKQMGALVGIEVRHQPISARSRETE